MAATAETAQLPPPHDRSDRRRRPFSSWMKKLANFKNGSGDSSTPPPTTTTNTTTTKRHTYQSKSAAKKHTLTKNNNPYRGSGNINPVHRQNGNRSFSTVPTGTDMSQTSLDRSRRSLHSSLEGLPPTIGNKSVAPTLSTSISGPAHSEAAGSHDAPSSGETTNGTAGCGISGRGGDSTFSSPAPSVRSLTTTLTTIQSAVPPAPSTHHAGHANSIHFSHQFPTSPPPNALPAHMAPPSSGGHPATYATATANNLLTDNASILTLASSSKRRRRRSMDTDASIRALAPSSLFGGSRESLPLSVLSANIDSSSIIASHREQRAVPRMDERASIYSATGVAPALPSERNSYYAGKGGGQSTAAGDGGSVKSGLLGHVRNDSVGGSIGGLGAGPSSPLASSAREGMGRLSRSNSEWVDTVEGEDETETETETEKEDKGEGEGEEHRGGMGRRK